MTKALDTPDNRGYTPDQSKIGTMWRHFKGGTYVIVGFIYDAERDLWTYSYRSSNFKDRTPYSRTPQNFHEIVKDDIKRFTETEAV